MFYGLFEDWESSIPPAAQRRQLSKHSSLRGTACPVHHITRTALANVCVTINCNCHLCRTYYSVPTAAGGAGNLLPCCVLTFVSPKEGLTASSFVSLLIPIFIQRKPRLESGKQNCSGLWPSSKEHGKGGTWQGNVFQ